VFSPLEQFEFGSVVLSVMVITETDTLSVSVRASLLLPGTDVLYPVVEAYFSLPFRSVYCDSIRRYVGRRVLLLAHFCPPGFRKRRFGRFRALVRVVIMYARS
jgi:hypothetical protein